MHSTASTSERNPISVAAADAAEGLAATNSKAALLQIAHKLQRLVTRIENSLVEQFRQLDDLLANEPRPSNTDSLREAERAEFKQRQAAWERQKDEELYLIEQERTQLSEAWSSLEAEQRRILAEDALRRAEASAARDTTPCEEPDEAANRTARSANNDATPRTRSVVVRDAVSRESVLVEYEQLKSDVQKHAKRLRRAR